MNYNFKGNIRELDGLRGVAILLVLLYHFWPESNAPVPGVGALAQLGWMGVDLFFVISGFLIGGILLDTVHDPGYFRNFYARRSLRIFPLYYLFLIVVFALVPAFQTGDGYFQKPFIQESGSPAWYFLYLGNLRQAFTSLDPPYFLAPLWSLSIEEQFYITFPFLVASLKRPVLWRVLCGLVLLAPLCRIAAVVFFPSLPGIATRATFARVDVIACGCLLALGLRMDRIRITQSAASRLALSMIAVFLAVVAMGGMNRQSAFCVTGGFSVTAFLFASIVLAAVVNRDAAVTAVLRWKPLTYMGKICYGTYLLQRPAEGILLKALPRLGVHAPEAAWWLFILKMAAAIAAGSASWWFFESRILRFKQRFQSKSHPQQEPALAQVTGRSH